jgi:hypothetical protein
MFKNIENSTGNSQRTLLQQKNIAAHFWATASIGRSYRADYQYSVNNITA